MVLTLSLVLCFLLVFPGSTTSSTCHPCSCYIVRNRTVLDCERLNLKSLPTPPNNLTLIMLLRHNHVTCDSFKKFVSSYSSHLGNWLDIRHNPNFNCSCISSLVNSFGIILSDCPPSTMQPRVHVTYSTSLNVTTSTSSPISNSTAQPPHNVSKPSTKLWISWVIGSSSGTMLLIVVLMLFKKFKKCLVWKSRTTRQLSTNTFHLQLYGNNEEDEEEEEILFDITGV